MTNEPKYWVEARTNVKEPAKVISYGVWHKNAKGTRECLKHFSVARRGGWDVALYLANTLRDDLNAGERVFTYDPDKMFPFSTSKHTMTD